MESELDKKKNSETKNQFKYLLCLEGIVSLSLSSSEVFGSTSGCLLLVDFIAVLFRSEQTIIQNIPKCMLLE